MSTMTVDEYINQFDGEINARLITMRQLIRAEVPAAEEGYMYGLVGYKLNKKPLVYFGGFKSHVGFYATPNGHEAFIEEFSKYKQGKGSVQFPLDQPLPQDLIKKVIEYRTEQVGSGGQDDQLPHIGKPAVNALAAIGVTKKSQLKAYSERELLALHGVGPKAIRILKEANVLLKEK